MPRRFFRKFAFKRHELTRRPWIRPFRRLMNDQKLWGIRRKTVVPAVAWGTFVAFLPIPGHVLVAILGSLVMRCNIPVAALATFITNPLTIGPLYYFTYRIGARMLEITPEKFRIELSIEWLNTTFQSVWQPLLLGSVLVGLIASFFAYAILDLVWRLSLADYKTRKRNDRYR